MRLRTLPVSMAGVVAGCAYAVRDGVFQPVPAVLCLLFAVLAQIASNFANEYFDYKGGFDTAQRTGPRRGVSCGDISPAAMLRAAVLTLGAACAAGCGLIYYGGWWLLPVGILIALGALAYSTGPFPLSHHCMGEVAVFLFFGLAPVNLTYYVQALEFTRPVLDCSIAMGLLGAMVLICNNFRDMDEDRKTGKHTLATVLGRYRMAFLYLLSGVVAATLLDGSVWSMCVTFGIALWGFFSLLRTDIDAKRCTKLLALTSVGMLAASLLLFV